MTYIDLPSFLARHPHAFGFGNEFSSLNHMQITSSWIEKCMVLISRKEIGDILYFYLLCC